MNLKLPKRILDLHTHLFNARYIPLASVIANAMGKDESILADWLAKLLEQIAGSSYELKNRQFEIKPTKEGNDRNQLLLDNIWSITEHELLLGSCGRTPKSVRSKQCCLNVHKHCIMKPLPL